MDTLPTPITPKITWKQRVEAFNLATIANATNYQDLKGSLNQAILNTQHLEELQELKDLQDSAKALLADKSDQKLLNNFTSKFVKHKKQQSVQNGEYVRSSVHPNDADYIDGARQSLIDEYKITTASELLIVDTVVHCYFKYMHVSKAFNTFIEDNDGNREYDNQVWVNKFKELNKAVDIAHRQLLSALTFLKEFKQPAINVKVHTKEVFVGQNQQFNKNS